MLVSRLSGESLTFEVADATSETLRDFKARVALEFGVRPRDVCLILGERLLGHEELVATLQHLGMVDKSNVTLKSAPAQVVQTQTEWAASSEPDLAGGCNVARAALFGDGTFVLAAYHGGWGESDMHSGWNAKMTYDVARGTYRRVDEDAGRVARCSFAQHIQRTLFEDHWEARHGTDESSDSGWQEMDSQASLKWQRIELAGETWPPVDDDVRTGGARVLGLPFRKIGHGRVDKHEEWPEIVTEALAMLTLEADSD